ncbi:alpha/beta fold hydrolase [Dongia deserti]|uniref:alpha/beta fold hydrolase n=1 Tax=Dongia deserti TaxID=2268030 RepID=UPI0013C52240|nr:alpha/beta hydrolase [Dongia deserti]
MILFVHGWGYDAGFWDPLRDALQVPSVALDLGYFGAAKTVIPDGVTLLVGHSLGFLWLAREQTLRHLPLIGINAFPRFLEAEDYTPAIAPRVLDRMKRRLSVDPAAVLAEFWQRAGAPGPAATPQTAALAEGLDHLATWNARENLATRASSLRLIAGEEDAIVAPAMTRMAFKDLAIDWLPGGHALPQTHPAKVARLIRP